MICQFSLCCVTVQSGVLLGLTRSGNWACALSRADTLNNTVKQYLRRWFVSQGGVKVSKVARHHRSNHPMQAAPASSQVQRIEVKVAARPQKARGSATTRSSVVAEGHLEVKGAQNAPSSSVTADATVDTTGQAGPEASFGLSLEG